MIESLICRVSFKRTTRTLRYGGVTRVLRECPGAIYLRFWDRTGYILLRGSLADRPRSIDLTSIALSSLLIKVGRNIERH